MESTLLRLEPAPKQVSPHDGRLASPYRLRWPLVPPGSTTETVKFGKPLDIVLEWAAKHKRKEWIVELDADGASEAEVAKALEQVGAAAVTRLAISQGSAELGRKWLRLIPPSVEQLALDVWNAAPDFAPLAKLPALRSLALMGPYNDGEPVDLTVLAKCQQLAQLALQAPSIVLAAPPRLVELDVRKVGRLATKPIPLKMLSIVAVAKDAASEACLAALIASATAALEELIVTVDANKLQKLGSLAFPTGLRRLTLNISARRKISLKPLAQLAQLEELSLKGSFTDLSALRGLVELRDAALFLDEPNELDVSKMTKLCRIETWTDDKTLTIHGWKPPAKKR